MGVKIWSISWIVSLAHTIITVQSFGGGVPRLWSSGRGECIHRTCSPILRAVLEVDATSEVVGGHGKIGSLFLQEHGAIAVPRGVAPGVLTSTSSGGSSRNSSSPIIVAIPCQD